jgi:uncharacterized protein YcbX
MRTVARLSIAPVKSMRLVHPASVRLERFGVPENRLFYVIDEDGRLLTASKNGALLAVRPHYDPRTERLWLHMPDGSSVEGSTGNLGRAVESTFYGRPVVGRVVEGPWTEALSDYMGRPVHLARAQRPGEGNDDAPVSLSSTASADHLARRTGSDAARDSRRFRMLVEVDGCEPFEEDDWLGRRVGVGEAVVEPVSPVARCVITTLDPSSGTKDLDTLRVLRDVRGPRAKDSVVFGVYADVVQPGTIQVGDPVRPTA